MEKPDESGGICQSWSSLHAFCGYALSSAPGWVDAAAKSIRFPLSLFLMKAELLAMVYLLLFLFTEFSKSD
jgi:hypothetical protein